ncbi:MAG: hypothetical protein JWP24_959, partial [Marmoricola sp.]|nr:hypothetical protein [Marmoricola sp.]
MVTFDYRGTGATRSTMEAGSAWTTSTFAGDAVAVLDSLGIGAAHVYG